MDPWWRKQATQFKFLGPGSRGGGGGGGKAGGGG